MLKAIGHHEYGPPGVLKLEDVDTPVMTADEVIVRVLEDLVNMIYAFLTFYGGVGEALGAYGRGLTRVLDASSKPVFDDRFIPRRPRRWSEGDHLVADESPLGELFEGEASCSFDEICPRHARAQIAGWSALMSVAGSEHYPRYPPPEVAVAGFRVADSKRTACRGEPKAPALEPSGSAAVVTVVPAAVPVGSELRQRLL